MAIRKPWLWMAVAAITVAAYSTTLLRDDMDEKETQTAGRDLFPFVQALPADPPMSGPVQGDQQLAPRQHTDEQAANAFRLEEEVRRLRAQGASDDEVYRVRATALSPEKAAALAGLDREEAVWQHRVAIYLSQRQALDGNPQAILALRNRLFNNDEQVRLSGHEPVVAPLTGSP